jgi:glycosyltransferase involved in cell wall biosynthesis
MRILQLSDLYPPVIGGLERHVETLARELARRGHQLSVATLAHPDAPDEDLRGDVHLYRLGGWYRALAPRYADPERPFHPPVPDPGVMRGLARVLARERPQLIHAHGWILHSAAALLRHRTLPLIATLHDYGVACAPRILLPHADAYVAVSAAVAAACRPATGTAPLRVIPTFLPDALFAPRQDPRPAFLPPHDGYVLYVGALAPHKGVDLLLDAYRTLAPAPPLLLLGTAYGHTERRYPEGVRVATQVPHPQVMAAWAGACFGIVPSIWPEPLPQVLLEAMLSGKAIIASATGGIPEVVQHEHTGLLVPPGDATALRAAIQRLLGDSALCTRMGTAGRQAVERYRVSVVVDALEALYATILATTGGVERNS